MPLRHQGLPRHDARTEALKTMSLPMLHWGTEALWQQLEPLLPGLSVEVVPATRSTNTMLLERARALPDTASDSGDVIVGRSIESAAFGRRAIDLQPCLLVAEHQTAGRGRQGRVWQSAAGASLTFSLALPLAATDWSGLSLAVGVAVARALEKEGFGGIDLKWPNDLVFRHHKLGGILIEVNGDALGPSTVVVGVGINARMPREVRREIAQPVTDLQTVAGRGAKPVDRNRVLARLIAEVASMLAAYAEHGFAPIAAEWQQRHAYQGKPVKLVLPDGAAVKGTVAGVDASGALVLADGPRRSRFLSGELSLRRGN